MACEDAPSTCSASSVPTRFPLASTTLTTGPGGPCGPIGPAAPAAPFAPAAPAGPTAPVSPFGPSSPAGPAGPVTLLAQASTPMSRATRTLQKQIKGTDTPTKVSRTKDGVSVPFLRVAFGLGQPVGEVIRRKHAQERRIFVEDFVDGDGVGDLETLEARLALLDVAFHERARGPGRAEHEVELRPRKDEAVADVRVQFRHSDRPADDDQLVAPRLQIRLERLLGSGGTGVVDLAAPGSALVDEDRERQLDVARRAAPRHRQKRLHLLAHARAAAGAARGFIDLLRDGHPQRAE